jgi:hypothetical protein
MFFFEKRDFLDNKKRIAFIMQQILEIDFALVDL